MNISTVIMRNGNPGLEVQDVILSDVEIDGQQHERYEVVVYIEDGVESPARNNLELFEAWILDQAHSAIRTKDDRRARRPNIWPDQSQHTDVYRAWHLDNISISIWTSPAPKFGGAP